MFVYYVCKKSKMFYPWGYWCRPPASTNYPQILKTKKIYLRILKVKGGFPIKVHKKKKIKTKNNFFFKLHSFYIFQDLFVLACFSSTTSWLSLKFQTRLHKYLCGSNLFQIKRFLFFFFCGLVFEQAS